MGENAVRNSRYTFSQTDLEIKKKGEDISYLHILFATMEEPVKNEE